MYVNITCTHIPEGRNSAKLMAALTRPIPCKLSLGFCIETVIDIHTTIHVHVQYACTCTCTCMIIHVHTMYNSHFTALSNIIRYSSHIPIHVHVHVQVSLSFTPTCTYMYDYIDIPLRVHWQESDGLCHS